MHFGFALDLWNIDLWDIDLLDNDFDLLVGHVRYRYSQEKFYLSPRHVFKSLEDMSSKRLQDAFSVRIFRLPRRLARCLHDIFKTYLQDVFKTSWKTKNCYAEDVLKTSSRQVLKTSSRRSEDQQMFALSVLYFLIFWSITSYSYLV